MAYSLNRWTRPQTVVETDDFLRQAKKVFGAKEERSAFVDYIARNPEAGDVIPETGGVRKIRWSRQGMGKRGGARVIYFYQHDEMPLYLLMVYAKARQENVSPDAKKMLKDFAARLKRSLSITEGTYE